jgi:hypothetical protein
VAALRRRGHDSLLDRRDRAVNGSLLALITHDEKRVYFLLGQALVVGEDAARVGPVGTAARIGDI